MKAYLFLFLLLIALDTFSQKCVLEKLWVGNNDEYILADSNVIRFETFSDRFGNIRVAHKYLIRNDTLKIFQADFNNQTFTSDFIIDTTHKGKLSLTSMNENAILLTNRITLTGVKNQLIFKEINQVSTDTIQFEKIIFNSTNCYGHCPETTLQLDKNRQVQFIGGKYAIKQGTFKSTVPESIFLEFIEILKLAELDKIECNKFTNIDAPTYSIEIHYNNKIRQFKSCMLPFVTDKLLAYLLDLPKKITLMKSAEPMDIKFKTY